MNMNDRTFDIIIIERWREENWFFFFFFFFLSSLMYRTHQCRMRSSCLHYSVFDWSLSLKDDLSLDYMKVKECRRCRLLHLLIQLKLNLLRSSMTNTLVGHSWTRKTCEESVQILLHRVFIRSTLFCFQTHIQMMINRVWFIDLVQRHIILRCERTKKNLSHRYYWPLFSFILEIGYRHGRTPVVKEKISRPIFLLTNVIYFSSIYLHTIEGFLHICKTFAWRKPWKLVKENVSMLISEKNSSNFSMKYLINRK